MQIAKMEDNLVLGYDMLQLFKEEADQIRKEMDVMMNTLVEKAEQVQEDVHNDTRRDYLGLKNAIHSERDSNNLLYRELQALTKETISTKRKIAYFKAKVEELEQHVGILDPNYVPMHLSSVVVKDTDGEWDQGITSPIEGNDFQLNVDYGYHQQNSASQDQLKGHSQRSPQVDANVS